MLFDRDMAVRLLELSVSSVLRANNDAIRHPIEDNK